jgi:tRNAThr (cytosine32-N3)-methyltransferase
MAADPDSAGSPATLVAATAELTLESPGSQAEVPAHRSHDPEASKKRTDPFEFGNRLLGEEDDVFEFNAWDRVETDDAFKEYSEKQFEFQRQSPVSDFDKSKWFSCFSTQI